MFVNQDFEIINVKESHQGSTHLQYQRDLALQEKLVSACVFYKKEARVRKQGAMVCSPFEDLFNKTELIFCTSSVVRHNI